MFNVIDEIINFQKDAYNAIILEHFITKNVKIYEALMMNFNINGKVVYYHTGKKNIVYGHYYTKYYDFLKLKEKLINYYQSFIQKKILNILNDKTFQNDLIYYNQVNKELKNDLEIIRNVQNKYDYKKLVFISGHLIHIFQHLYNKRDLLKSYMNNKNIIKNISKMIYDELQQVVYRYEFYVKVVIDEKDYDEIVQFFGKK